MGSNSGDGGVGGNASWVSIFLFLFFLLLGCGFDNELIMVGLWVVACGGCGLWARWWCC